MEESRSQTSVGVVGSATSFPTRAADSVSDSVRHSCSSFRCVIRSVSTCPPRGNLVDGLPRAPSRGENAMRFFQKYFDKNRDCSASCGQICSKTVPGGLWYVPVRMVCSRGPGKFCSPRLTGLKVLKMCSILEKVALARWFPYFLHFVDFDRPWVIRRG